MPSSACDWSSDVCSSDRSEEHTSELQSRSDLVCRLLLEKKKKEKSDRLAGCAAEPARCTSDGTCDIPRAHVEVGLLRQPQRKPRRGSCVATSLACGDLDV